MHNKKALIALLIGAGLVFVVSRMSVEPLAERELLEVSDYSPQQTLLRAAVGDMDFYRQLTVGSSLALQLDADNSDAFAEVVVTKVVLEGEVTSIRGIALSQDANGSMLMTIGDKFIHIFLALDKGIYEFSGKDFQGVLERTKDMRFANDTALRVNQSVELTDQPVRRAVVVPVNNQ